MPALPGDQAQAGGIDEFVILERAQDVGGVWRDNHYPGCSCDVPSQICSFSFEPDPDWSEMYASQSGILGYLRRCADKYGNRPHVRFATEVVPLADQREARAGPASIQPTPKESSLQIT